MQQRPLYDRRKSPYVGRPGCLCGCPRRVNQTRGTLLAFTTCNGGIPLQFLPCGRREAHKLVQWHSEQGAARRRR